MSPPRQSAGSVTRDVTAVDRHGSQDIPRSLPRFEGFASTLGGFARSPQVSRAPSRFLPRNDEHAPRLSEPGPQPSSSAFVRSLQTPLLHPDAPAASSSYRHSLPAQPTSLLARSIGSLTEVFNRQASYPKLAIPCTEGLHYVQWMSYQQWRLGSAESSSRTDWRRF